MSELTIDYKEYLHESLKDPIEAAEYLNAALEEGDISVFMLAMRDVAEARGVAKIAKTADLNRENIYRMLSDQGNPRLSSVFALIKALGVQLHLKPSATEAEVSRPGLMTNVSPKLNAEKPSFLASTGRVSGSRKRVTFEVVNYNGSTNESAAA